jgi:hypothetical protein
MFLHSFLLNWAFVHKALYFLYVYRICGYDLFHAAAFAAITVCQSFAIDNWPCRVVGNQSLFVTMYLLFFSDFFLVAGAPLYSAGVPFYVAGDPFCSAGAPFWVERAPF